MENRSNFFVRHPLLLGVGYVTWYVCPLLHRGELVGRVEAKISGDTLVVQRLWREEGVDFDEDAFDRALERHAEACRATAVKRLRAARRR